MSGPSVARHAVYFAPPPQHPLWQAGCAWLGRDAQLDGPAEPPRAGVAAPWRYGFHATLKPPLRLVAGATEAAFVDAVAAVAARHACFDLPALQVAWLADFLALRPTRPLHDGHPLRRLADDCVAALDRWRAPPRPGERARRDATELSTRQREHAVRWGYAHVFEDWRFHMTLSDGLAQADERQRQALQHAAQAHFAAALALPLRCESLCVFVEPAPGLPLVLRHRLPLRA